MSLCSFALTIDRNLVCTTEVADAELSVKSLAIVTP